MGTSTIISTFTSLGTDIITTTVLAFAAVFALGAAVVVGVLVLRYLWHAGKRAFAGGR